VLTKIKEKQVLLASYLDKKKEKKTKPITSRRKKDKIVWRQFLFSDL